MERQAVYVICRKDRCRLVEVMKCVREEYVVDVSVYLVRDLMTGQEFECQDYYLEMDRHYNEMEAVAWAAAHTTMERK